MPPKEFEFVNSTTSKVPQCKNLRTLIRKQAMKDVAAARRRRGNYGKKNLRQLPDSSTSTPPTGPDKPEIQKSIVRQAGSSCEVQGFGSHLCMECQSPRCVMSRLKSYIPPRNPMQSDYLRLGVSSGFSILNICPLTSLHLGVAKMSHFASEGAEAVRVFPLPPGPSSWLAFIPSRYGNVESLSYAADCVVEGLKWNFGSTAAASEGTSVARSYMRALRSLQAVLKEAKESRTTETLCAAALLGTYELLDTGRSHGWMQHAGGVAKLIEHRGPVMFEDDFDKAILLAHIGPIVTQALMSGRRCFLATERWKRVLFSSIQTSRLFGGRIGFAMSLWANVVSLPDLFNMAEELIHSEHPSPDSSVSALIDHALVFWEDLSSWYRKYSAATGLSNNINACGTFDYLDYPPCLSLPSPPPNFIILRRNARIWHGKSYNGGSALKMPPIHFRLDSS
ncbi:hypothetical protein AYL99_01082 [Fonsecaea erecta]|uniref:Uncharacterized protein n=1 Tax=Fonsecaea erecta TaxID=1367422 RepID=A0A178ZZ11_9EURO|nr:hypothetical protein AYL99_01082 [Fonsecaea erecta]OAP65110.1 hypothetical protein AYL99_01082 [Fonsecaea erecta]